MPANAKPPTIEPANLSAQLAYRGRGNPPSTHPSSAIANSFPGLEFDFRNAWKQVLLSLELHESDVQVVAVEPDGAAAQQGIAAGFFLLAVDGRSTVTEVRGPRRPGEAPEVLLQTGREWTNALAEVLAARRGQEVECLFQRSDSEETVTARLTVRDLFSGAALTEDAAQPGALTQGLCSPWQSDYRECGCYYWAASRPDYVNVEVDAAGDSTGHNWMVKDRNAATPRRYTPDNSEDPAQLSYEDLYRAWEQGLRFIVAGRDEE